MLAVLILRFGHAREPDYQIDGKQSRASHKVPHMCAERVEGPVSTINYTLLALRELSREAGSEAVLLAGRDGVASAIPAKTRSWRSSRQRGTVRRPGEHFVHKVTDCAESDLDSLPSAQNVTLYTKCHPVHKMFRPAQPARCPHWTSSCAPPPTPLAPADETSANWVARPPGGAPLVPADGGSIPTSPSPARQETSCQLRREQNRGRPRSRRDPGF